MFWKKIKDKGKKGCSTKSCTGNPNIPCDASMNIRMAQFKSMRPCSDYIKDNQLQKPYFIKFGSPFRKFQLIIYDIGSPGAFRRIIRQTYVSKVLQIHKSQALG